LSPIDVFCAWIPLKSEFDEPKNLYLILVDKLDLGLRTDVQMSPNFDIAVVGAGVVGASIALGLSLLGQKVVVLDEGDNAPRPSRGNFALVWIQGKGLGNPMYSAWSQQSSNSWSRLAAMLREATGIDVGFSRPGGFMPALSEDELTKLAAKQRRVLDQPGVPQYDIELLDHTALARILPQIGPDVAGATFCPLDGHVNALRFFRALHESMRVPGVDFRPLHKVEDITHHGGEYILRTENGPVRAGKVVLAAGHANAKLAPMVGLTAHVRPQRGQIIVTERIAPFLHYPLGNLRQTDEGSVMIGDSVEEVGFDDRVETGVLSTMADRAVRIFPFLSDAKVVRTWGALRVMSKDGFPIYDQLETAPGAFLVTCHSGVTLAAVHVFALAEMIAGGRLSDEMGVFSARRFNVSQAA
jgi:hydrogen cyanide synthase HcnC